MTTEALGAPELTPVRPGHEFNEPALIKFLQQVLGEGHRSMDVLQFEGGQSNPTFRIIFNDKPYVLRKQPSGKLLPSAHQVGREYRVMSALANTPVPVPEMIALHEEADIIGTSFYIMELVEGRVFTDILLPEITAEERTALYENIVDIMADLHQINPEAVGLGDFGRPGNYYARQINRWSKQYQASKTIEIKEMDALMEWLPEHIPESDEVSVVHGDYRVGNAILHPTEPRIVAVLDWELSTLGHPLADLAYHCQNYHTEPEGETSLNRGNLEQLGIPSEASQLAHYCKKTGRSQIDNWHFYLGYNLFRSAAIIQGVYKRGIDGNASSTQALEYKDACAERAHYAWQVLQAGD